MPLVNLFRNWRQISQTITNITIMIRRALRRTFSIQAHPISEYNSKNLYQRRFIGKAASIAHSAVDQDPNQPTMKQKLIKVTFLDLDGHRHTVEGLVGERLTDVAKRHNIKLGMDPTCQGHNSCTDCHVIISNEYYNLFPQPSIDENEMLEMAPNVAENSRLGCQLILQENMDGLVVALPPESTTPVTIDAYFRA